MHHSCQSDVIQQSIMTSFVRKRSNVLGKLFESVIYKLPVTSHWKTYSKASPNRDIVRFTRVVQNIEVHSAFWTGRGAVCARIEI